MPIFFADHQTSATSLQSAFTFLTSDFCGDFIGGGSVCILAIVGSWFPILMSDFTFRFEEFAVIMNENVGNTQNEFLRQWIIALHFFA